MFPTNFFINNLILVKSKLNFFFFHQNKSNWIEIINQLRVEGSPRDVFLNSVKLALLSTTFIFHNKRILFFFKMVRLNQLHNNLNENPPVLVRNTCLLRARANFSNTYFCIGGALALYE